MKYLNYLLSTPHYMIKPIILTEGTRWFIYDERRGEYCQYLTKKGWQTECGKENMFDTLPEAFEFAEENWNKDFNPCKFKVGDFVSLKTRISYVGKIEEVSKRNGLWWITSRLISAHHPSETFLRTDTEDKLTKLVPEGDS